MHASTHSSKVDLTRRRIVRAAEKIFAIKGYRAMTLRDVTREAQVNLAAVNYHFGSKANLMRAVIQDRFTPINEERLRRLDQLAESHQPKPIPPAAIFNALIEPLYEQAAKDSSSKQLIRIIGRAFTEPADFMRAMHKEFFTELSLRFLQELQRSCPQLPHDELQYRFFFAVSTMLGSIIEQTRLENVSRGALEPESMDVIAKRLVRYVVAGFEQNNASH